MKYPILNIPLGIEDYKEIVDKNYLYIDKTLFIKEFLNKKHKSTLITRPRRFGKTLNISTIFHFLNIDSKDQSYLFENTNIWNEQDIVEQHFAKYPVIFITLKDLKGNDFNTIFVKLKNLISSLFLKEEDFINSISSDALRNKFSQFFNLNTIDALWSSSLKNLTWLLNLKYGKNVVVLIDEYDTPIHQGFENGFYKEAISFFSYFLSEALKGNEYLNFSLMTGILKIAKEGIFSGLNNLKVCTVLNNEYSDKFGFTEEEILNMDHSNSISLIKEWYNGYHFGNSKIYNPWSVLSFFDQELIPKTYWANTSGDMILKNLIKKLKFDITELFDFNDSAKIKSKEIKIDFNENILLENIESSITNINSLLVHAGYLTITKHTTSSYFAIIPNKEILIILEKMAKELVLSNSGETDFKSKLEVCIETGNNTILEYYLNKFLSESISSHDLPEWEMERSYHLYILGLFSIIQNNYFIKSNREAGFGRYDIAIIPKNTNKSALIIEFKRAQSLKTIKNAALDGLKQIKLQSYTLELESLGYKKINYFGIGCFKKQVLVLSDKTT